MSTDQRVNNPIKWATGTVVSIAQSQSNHSTFYHLALKISSENEDRPFEIITLFGPADINDLPFVVISDKVTVRYSSQTIVADQCGEPQRLLVQRQLLNVSIDWHSAYRRTSKYGDYS